MKNFIEDKEKLAYYMHYAMIIANVLLIVGAVIFVVFMLKQLKG